MLLVHPGADVLGDLVGDLDLGEVLAGPVDQQPQPLGDVDGLQQLALLHVTEIGRVARGVGQCRRIGDAVDVVDDLPGLAALQHGQQQLLVLGGQGLDRVGGGAVGTVGTRSALGGLGDLDPQRRARPGGAGADVRAAFAAHDGGLPGAAGHPPDLQDRGQHAVGGVAVVEAGRDQQLGRAVGRTGLGRLDGGLRGVVQCDRHDHAGQHDRLGHEQDGNRDRRSSGFGHHTSKVDSPALNLGGVGFVPARLS